MAYKINEDLYIGNTNKQLKDLLVPVHDAYSTSTTDTYSCNYINSIIESGSNEIGEYIKYANGRLITMHKVTRNLARTAAWGNMYESTTQADLGNYPITFKDIPFVYITLHGANSTLEAVQFTSANNAGKVYVLGPTYNASEDYVFQVLAIGKWK